MDDRSTPHMDPETFRRIGREVVDFVADYLERVGSYPVHCASAPGDVRRALPEHPPDVGEPWEHVLRDVRDVILPGLTHWQSPNFFAYFPANASGASILGELLAAGLGVQGMLWTTGPACTELETLVLDWLVEMLALPRAFHSSTAGGGVIQDTASSAVLCALIAARERATQGGVNARGLREPLVGYTSDQAHSSVEKAFRIAGLGSAALRRIETDANHALRPDALAAAIARDRAAGRVPFFCCATVGTTSSHGMDPLDAIGPVCARDRLWLHVDAAMAGTAALCPEFRTIHAGLEHADSYGFNPHKWMFTNFDCSAFWVRERHALIQALAILPEYLRNPATASGQVIDYRDWQIPLGRRFRALKLWFVIRHYGVEGLRAHVRDHVAWTQELAADIAADHRFEILAPHPLNLVCFRDRRGDEASRELLERANASGKLYLTHTRLRDAYALRWCVGQTSTTRDHVRRAWDLVRSLAQP